MVQKVVEEIADDADEVVDLFLRVEFELTRQCERSRLESVMVYGQEH